MKFNNCKLSLVPLILTVILAILSACSNNNIEDQNVYMTQCISHPAENSKSKSFETFFTGNKVKCHALLWRIPQKYSPNTGDYPTQNDFISANIYIDDAPESVLPVWKARKQQKIKIKLLPYWENVSETVLARFKSTRTAVYSLEKVESNLNGWEVYDCKSKKCNVQEVLFYKAKPVEHLVSCSHGDKNKSYKNIPDATVCRVHTFVDRRIYAEYPVLYESFKDWDEVNNPVISFLESLMLN
ncbi:MAG: hypothetical protein ACSHWN_02655 [Methylophilaceae bacterium]